MWKNSQVLSPTQNIQAAKECWMEEQLSFPVKRTPPVHPIPSGHPWAHSLKRWKGTALTKLVPSDIMSSVYSKTFWIETFSGKTDNTTG